MKNILESNESRSTKLPIEMEAATILVLDNLFIKPIHALRRLASRCHAPEGLSHQPQEIK